MLRENLAKTQKVARLLRVRLLAKKRSKGSNRGMVISAMVFHKPDVQPDSGHLRFKRFRFSQKRDGFVPLFPAHGDHTEIRISCSGTRVEGEHPPKRRFRSLEVPFFERRLPLSKQRRWVLGRCRLARPASLTRYGLLCPSFPGKAGKRAKHQDPGADVA